MKHARSGCDRAGVRRARRLLAVACLALATGACARTATTSGGADSTSAFNERMLFQTQATERLAAIRTRMDSLRQELPVAGSQVNQVLRERAVILDTERDSVTARVAALSEATNEQWREAKLRTADLLDSLEVRIDRLSKDLRRSSGRGPSRT